MFTLNSPFQPTGDQPQAIAKLGDGIIADHKNQTLLGVTGSGKSLTYEQPIYLTANNLTQLQPIGQALDSIFKNNQFVTKNDTQIIQASDLTKKEYSTLSLNPTTGEIQEKPITQFTRHNSPKNLWKLTTACGKSITTTADHNFWVLRQGKLTLVQPQNIQPNDYLPTPRAILPDNNSSLNSINILNTLDFKRTFINYPSFQKLLNITPTTLKVKLGYYKSYQIQYAQSSISLHDASKFTSNFKLLNKLNTYPRNGKSLPINIDLNENWLNLIGLYIAEGHADRRYLLISAHEQKLKTLLIKWLTSLSIKVKERNLNPGDFQISHSLLSKVFSTWCGHNSRNKQLPPWFLQLNNQQLSTIISAYMSGDGNVADNEVTATSASHILISQLSYALLRFGIHTRIRTKYKYATNTVRQVKRKYYELVISGQSNLIKYYNSIGFILPRKHKKLSKIIHKSYNTNVDIIPIPGKMIIHLRQKYQLTQLQLSSALKVNRSYISMLEHNHRHVSYSKYQQLIKHFPKEENLQIFQNCFWTKVKKISQTTTNYPYVYDVAVSGNETFYAGYGGLIIHNTYTMANVIRDTQKPTLLITHNKTLAAQLYQEMREFFPDAAVSYFVSYYDFYQPEAYVPSSDTYIEKEAQINERIDKLRLATTRNIMTRKDVIVVASVSAIYNIGDPREYGKFELPIVVGDNSTWQDLAKKLIAMQYQRSEYEFSRGTFRVRGNALDIYPAYQDTAYRIEFGISSISSISEFDPISGLPAVASAKEGQSQPSTITIYPAKHYLLDPKRFKAAESEIRSDLDKEYKALKDAGKLIEAQRLLQRTNYDLEAIRELGYVNGIENYSRYFDDREIGDRPYALLDFFSHRYGDNWLTVLDESHMTIPQVRGMYNGDQARKKNLVDYGFRLKSALDNRPLKWDEFYSIIPHFIHLSATPNDWELEHSDQVVEQLVRPTGIIDPQIEIRPVENEIEDVIREIQIRAKKNERTLVTTLTKKTAEDLATYLTEKGVRANYLHSDVKTLERTDILERLRKNEFDALIGVNLLREGLDLPEVTLVAILDADREGFLRSRVSLIQTMGRAARNVKGEVILYADKITGSMKRAIEEIERRREYQLKYNKEHNITPRTITKPIRENVAQLDDTEGLPWQTIDSQEHDKIVDLDPTSLTPQDHAKWIKRLERDMKRLAKDMNFEAAIQVRDKLQKLRTNN